MYYALVDESGRIYDPIDKILVFAVVITDNLGELEKIIIKARERIPKRGKRRRERLSEIKFSLSGDNTRFFILKELDKYRVKIYVLVIDKEGRKITDNPENYFLLVYQALKKAIEENTQISHIIIDRHFTFITQRDKLNSYLYRKLGSRIFIEHVDSLQNPVITLADFAAGAIRAARVKKNFQYRSCIKKLIIEEKMLTWKQIKKR